MENSQLESISSVAAFSPDYIDKVFFIWYSAEQPIVTNKEFIASLPPDELGRKPSPGTMRLWKQNHLWQQRADRMDEEARKIAEIQAITVKADMLKRHASYGETLQQKGMKYFESYDVNSAQTALAMVKTGVEMERTSSGLPDTLIQVADMSPEKLIDSILKLFAKAGISQADMGDIIDGDITEILGLPEAIPDNQEMEILDDEFESAGTDAFEE